METAEIVQNMKLDWPAMDKYTTARFEPSTANVSKCCYECGRGEGMGSSGTTGHYRQDAKCSCVKIRECIDETIKICKRLISITASSEKNPTLAAPANTYWFKCKPVASGLARKKRSLGR